ncbi:MAG: alpha/beta hydrolase [Luteimonas sp.]
MDSQTSVLLDCIERETGPAPAWSVIWLHGLGADANDFVPLVPELLRKDWPAIRFVFPNAPVRAVTINNGVRMRAWYDIVDFDLANRADEAGVLESVAQIDALIKREATRGIPASRVILAGFSQGGAVALATGLRRRVPLAGLVALSTYLPAARNAGAALVDGAARQPVFMAHGTQDPVVPLGAGEQSAEWLRQAGFDIAWHQYSMPHSVCAEEIAALGDWFDARFAAG